MRNLRVSTFSACAVVSLAAAGCGSGDATTAEETTTTTVSSQAEASTSEETSAETASPSQGGVSTTGIPDEIGGIQDVAGEGFTARIQVLNEPKIHPSPIPTLTFPVVIDVDSGSMNAGPPHWKVRTLSGRTVNGSTITSIATSIGTDPIDGHTEGVVTFPDYSGNALAEDVSIAEVALYPSSMSDDPIARWKLPTPVAVPDIPTQGE